MRSKPPGQATRSSDKIVSFKQFSLNLSYSYYSDRLVTCQEKGDYRMIAKPKPALTISTVVLSSTTWQTVRTSRFNLSIIRRASASQDSRCMING